MTKKLTEREALETPKEEEFRPNLYQQHLIKKAENALTNPNAWIETPNDLTFDEWLKFMEQFK